MIRVRLSQMVDKRRVDLRTLSEITGLPVRSLSNLSGHRARCIRFETLEKLCRVFRCQPGDLLDYYSPRGKNPDHSRSQGKRDGTKSSS